MQRFDNINFTQTKTQMHYKRQFKQVACIFNHIRSHFNINTHNYVCYIFFQLNFQYEHSTT
jgi:hypothetical protein